MTIRVEGSALSDPRYTVLAQLAGLADADHARGKMEHLWAYCTDRQVYSVPVEIAVAVLGPSAVSALIRCGLGEENPADKGQIRIRGTKGRIEWLGKLRKNAKKGGKSRASQKASQMGTQMGTQTPAKSQPSSSPITLVTTTTVVPEQENPPVARAHASAHAREGAAPDRVSHGQQEGSRAPDPDPRATLRRRILGAIVPLHVEVFNRTRRSVASTARPMSVVGDPAERELAALLRELPSLDGVEEDCRHVLAVREAEALAARSVRYLGASVWTPQSFARAKSMTVEEAATGIARLAPRRTTESGFAALVAAAGGDGGEP